jgi:serine/threonine-protein kinase
MARVHLAQLVGAIGFARIVAIKRLLPHFGDDPEFLAMFRDEARIAARIRHPNVVSLLDVVQDGNELFLVMDYVEGDSLAKLLWEVSTRGALAPREIVMAVMYGTLQGLHAAHEARSETGEPLHVVHRDVSPQNILVGVDGSPRVLDFGIAKAVGRLARTQVGHVKGKFGYIAPEQLGGGEVTPRTDVYGASVVLWEALTGARLFSGDDTEMARQILEGQVPLPSRIEPGVPKQLERLVMRGLARDPRKRFSTALEMAEAIDDLGGMASSLEVGEWVTAMAATTLSERAAMLAAIESPAAPPGRTATERPAPPASARKASATFHAPVGDQTASATFHAPVGDQTASATFHAPVGDGTLSATIQPGTPASYEPARTGVVPPEASPRRGALASRVAIASALVIAALVVLLVVLLQNGREAPATASGASGLAPAPSAPAAPVESMSRKGGPPPIRSSATASAAPAPASPTATDGEGAVPQARPSSVRPHVAPRPRPRPKVKRPGGMPDFGI